MLSRSTRIPESKLKLNKTKRWTLLSIILYYLCAFVIIIVIVISIIHCCVECMNVLQLQYNYMKWFGFSIWAPFFHIFIFVFCSPFISSYSCWFYLRGKTKSLFFCFVALDASLWMRSLLFWFFLFVHPIHTIYEVRSNMNRWMWIGSYCLSFGFRCPYIIIIAEIIIRIMIE